MRYFPDPNREKRWMWFVLAAYLLLNAIVWLSINEDIRLTYAGDGSSWYQPSVGFYLTGDFIDPNNPDTSTTYRPPAFPIFAATLFKVFGGPSPGAIAVGQIILLLLTGLLFRNIVNDRLPGWGSIGMALLLLNPNVFTIAQYTQSDTLFLFFMTIALWGVLCIAKGRTSLRYPLIIGAALAFACLTRATAQFLIIALPIALPLIDLANQTPRRIPASFAKGLAAAAVAVVLLIPWANYVQNIEGEYDLSSSEVKARYIWDQISILEAQHSGISYHDSEAKQAAQHAALAAGYGEKWSQMSEPEQYRAILREGYRTLLSYPALSIAEAYARSIFQFLTAGGSGRWHYLILEDPGQLTKLWFKTEQTDVLGMVREYFRSGSGLAFLATGVCIAFVLIARVLGLVGIAAIVTAKQWSLLVVLLSYISYFAFVHLFVGNSRYRISVEPALMLLFLYGFVSLYSRFMDWRRPENTRHE